MLPKLLIWKYAVRVNKKPPNKSRNYAFQNPAELAGWLINQNRQPGEIVTGVLNTELDTAFITWLESCLEPAGFEIRYKDGEKESPTLTVTKV